MAVAADKFHQVLAAVGITKVSAKGGARAGAMGKQRKTRKSAAGTAGCSAPLPGRVAAVPRRAGTRASRRRAEDRRGRRLTAGPTEPGRRMERRGPRRGRLGGPRLVRANAKQADEQVR